jgi:hypothetical protein
VRRLSPVLAVVYMVIGFIVANDHNYFTRLRALKPFISAVLAVLLWPLILLGISLHIK